MNSHLTGAPRDASSVNAARNSPSRRCLRHLLLLAGVAGGMALSGCTVGPNFTPPQSDSPAAWHPTPPSVPSQTFAGSIDTLWWNKFDDAELTALVQRIGQQNLDVAEATQRVLQARSQRQIALSQGLPRLDEQSAYQHKRISPQGEASLEVPAPNAPFEYNLYQNGLSASWELDLFGRVRRSVEAANANLQAAAESRHAAALAAVGELVRDYMQLRGVQTDIALTRQNLALAQRNAALVSDRYRNGVATTLDQAQAAAAIETVAASLPGLETTQARLINAIGLLLALPPRALEAELTPVPGSDPLQPLQPLQPRLPAQVPVGLPSALARQRPDIREAEANLHSATAATGVAVASFYPDVTLMGSINLNGLQFSNAFAMADRAFSVGPSVDIPLFQGGRLRGTLHLREAAQREAALKYHQTVLKAWGEVDDALTAYGDIQRQRARLDEAARQDELALTAAQQRYAQGAADYLNVVAAQRAVLEAQRGVADNQTQQENALVTLYLALGGGWESVGE